MRLGVDLGGTKIEAMALDEGGQPRWRKRIATPASAGYDAIIAAVVALVGEADLALGTTTRVGVGTPGAPSPSTGLMRNANTSCLNGRALRADLAGALGRDVRLANDANCFALSEATDGAGACADVVFGVIVGTGTGGGIVAHGRLLVGPNALAGEWGHNPLPWPRADEQPGPTCYCGKRGCIETFLSGPGLARDHVERCGAHVAAPEIFDAADAGDAEASATVARYVDRLARALATVIDIVDPDVIVLGGGLSNAACLYDAVPAAWASYAFCDAPLATRFVPARHGDASGVRGAAWLWPA